MTSIKTFCTNHRKDLFYLGLIFLMVCLFFDEAIRMKGIYFSGDIRTIILPFRHFIRESIFSGQIPLWSPYQLAGYPIYADYGTSFFYPLTYIFFVFFPFVASINYYITFLFLFCGIGFYLYARYLDMQPIAAFGTAVTAAFSGFMLVRINHPTIIDIPAWLPWLLIMAETTVRKRSWIWAGWTGLLGGLMFSWLQPQIMTYIFVLVNIYLLVCLFKTKNTSLKTLFYVLLSYNLFFLSSSCLYGLTLQELVGQSYRAIDNPWVNVTYASVSPAHFIRLLFPLFYGQPEAFDQHHSDTNFVETTAYWGIIPLLFFITYLFLVPKTRRNMFFSLFFLLGLFLALGKYNPVFALHKFIPILHFGRCPGRFLILSLAGISMITGFTLNHLIDKYNTKTLINGNLKITIYILSFLAFVGIAILFFWHPDMISRDTISGRDNIKRVFFIIASLLLFSLYLNNKLKTKIFIPVILCVLVLDYFFFARVLRVDFNALFPPQILTQNSSIADFIHKDKSVFRIYTLTNQMWSTNKEVQDQYDTFYRNISEYYGIESFHCGNTGGIWRFYQMLGPLENAYWNIDEASQQKALNERLHILAKSNVKYIITKQTLNNVNLKLVFSDNSTHTNVYLINSWWPRLYISNQWVKVTNQNEGIDLLLSQKYKNIPILESSNDVPAISNSDTYQTTSNGLFFSKYKYQQVTITKNNNNSGLLVLNDYNYPGWKAFVNGKPVPIYTVNQLFRGVIVPETPSSIVFKYYPVKLYLGVGITLISFFILTILSILYTKRTSK